MHYIPATGHWRTELDSSKSNCIFLLFTVYSSHCLSMSTTSTKESKQTIIAERSRQNTEFVTNQPTPPKRKKKRGATNALYKYTDLIKFLGKQRLLFVQKLCFPIIFWLFWWRNESHGILVSVKHSSEGKKQMVLYTLCNKPQRRRNNL